jgi:GGDEF domain-containing protein
MFFEAEILVTYDRATGLFTRARMQEFLDRAFIERTRP